MCAPLQSNITRTLLFLEANERITKGAYVVQAGLEPSCFTTHFPFWNRRQSIAEIQRKVVVKYSFLLVDDVRNRVARRSAIKVLI